MPTFRLHIKCDNAAFEDLDAEVGRILRTAARKVEQQGAEAGSGGLYDVNGNRVGSYTLVTGARSSRTQPGRGRE